MSRGEAFWQSGLDGGGEVKIVLSDATGVVGYQGEVELVVADVDVGVVVGGFREGGYSGYEVDGLGEGGKGNGACELAVFEMPVGKGCEGGLDGFGD